MGSTQSNESAVRHGRRVENLGDLRHDDHIELVSSVTNKVIVKGKMEGWAWNSVTLRREEPNAIRLRVFERGRHTEKDYSINEHVLVYRTL